MRKSVLTAVAGAAATSLILITMAPALAASETTVTTLSVPANTAVAVPYDYDMWGDAGEIVARGAVEFPLTAAAYDGDFIHSTFAMTTNERAGCVRTVKSFTFTYTLEDYSPGFDDSVLVAGGLGTGEPLALTPTSASNALYAGDGGLMVPESGEGTDRVWVAHGLNAIASPQGGTLTVPFPNPVTAAQARGYVRFGLPDSSTWVIDEASFLVTDTCTAEADVPGTVLPRPVPPQAVETGVAAMRELPAAQ